MSEQRVPDVQSSSNPVMPDALQPVIPVVAAVRIRYGLHSADNRYWIVRRVHDGAHQGQAGMWEYPGGKVEEGENDVQALVREIREEFGVTCLVKRLLTVITTPMEDKLYRVAFHHVYFDGIPKLWVHDRDAWVRESELNNYRHLPSGILFNSRISEYVR